MTDHLVQHIDEEESAQDKAKQGYNDRELASNCPPIEYTYHQKPSYPEVDETRSWHMQSEVFLGTGLPPAPEGLEEDHPLLFAQKKLNQYKETFDLTTEKIRDFRAKNGRPKYHPGEETRIFRERMAQALENDTPELRASLMESLHRLSNQHQERTPEEVEAERRKLWDSHITAKQKYLGAMIAYLEIYAAMMKDRPRKKEDVEEYLAKVETVLVTHQSYNAARSFIHDTDGAVRESQDPTINHPYRLVIRAINRYLEKIADTDDHAEKMRLYNDLIVRIVVRMNHDTLEDTETTEEDLLVTNIRLTAQDTRSINALAAAADTQKDTTQAILAKTDRRRNPILRNWDKMIRGIRALSEPKGYKGENFLIENLRRMQESGEITDLNELCELYLDKADDRDDNLIELKYIKEPSKSGKAPHMRQHKKISDTHTFIRDGLRLAEQAQHADLKKALVKLATTCQNQIDGLLERFPTLFTKDDLEAFKDQFKEFQAA